MAEEARIWKGLDEVVIAESAISWVEGERGWLVYRGFDISQLMEGVSYESIVHLLLFGEPPTAEPPERLAGHIRGHRSLPDPIAAAVDAFPRELLPMDALRTAVSLLGEGSFRYPPTVDQGLELLARAPTMLTRFVRRSKGLAVVDPRNDLSHVANYLWMLTGVEPAPNRVRALERYFILLADHGMNASTFALRVVLSTQSDLAAAASAALAALKGPAHGGAPAKVIEMLDAVGAPSNAAQWTTAAVGRGDRLYGFGHRAYKVEDPRSIWLKRIARDVAAPPRFELAEAVEAAALETLGRDKPGRRLYTNVEFYGALVLEAVGLPPALFTPTFGLARTAGWAAHALEQAGDNRLIRPEVRYSGPDRGRRWPLPPKNRPAPAAGA